MTTPSDDAPVHDADWAHALFRAIATERNEVVAFAYFDAEWRCLGMRHCMSTDSGAIAVPIREVVRDVLALDGRLVLMAHNHPSGDHGPSQDDLTVTARLARTLDAIGVRLVDHLILGRDGYSSLREAGRL